MTSVWNIANYNVLVSCLCALIKHWRKAPWRGKSLLSLHIPIKVCHKGKLGQEPVGRKQSRGHRGILLSWLTAHVLLSLLSSTIHSGDVPLPVTLVLSHQLRKCPQTDRPTGQFHGSVPNLRFSLSQVTADCIKLTKFNQYKQYWYSYFLQDNIALSKGGTIDSNFFLCPYYTWKMYIESLVPSRVHRVGCLQIRILKPFLKLKVHLFLH